MKANGHLSPVQFLGFFLGKIEENLQAESDLSFWGNVLWLVQERDVSSKEEDYGSSVSGFCLLVSQATSILDLI